jgi:VanZ family protein
MNLFFTFLSLAYIFGIFFFADSSIVSTLATYNPYSLLHIPLYGILTILLILSIIPFKFKLSNPIIPINSRNAINRFLVAGLIALMVAIADEIHQAYIPSRDASILDVFLDMIGIILVMLIIMLYYKKKRSRITNHLITH